MEQKGKVKFTIIDDDNINIFMVRGIINSLSPGSFVECFTNPNDAVEYLLKFKTEHFRDMIIFLDLNMPILDGWDVLDKLMEHYGHHLPLNAVVYILTSSDINADIMKSKEYTMVKGFLTKPLKLAEFKKIIDTY